ncbi:MAG: globin family protein [Planctomycetota bacterium]|jgi:hemoglobin-like flavoprotein
MTAVAPVGAKLPNTTRDLTREACVLAFDRALDFAGRVIEALYASFPELKGAFALTVEGQEALLESAIQKVLTSLEDRVALESHLATYSDVLARHSVPTGAYGWLGLAILETLSAILVDAWTPGHRRAVARTWREIAVSLRG